MGTVHAGRGDLRTGEAMLRDARGRLEAALSPTDPRVLAVSFDLGVLLLDTGRPREAEPLVRAAFDDRTRRLPEGHWQRAHTGVALGRVLRALGRIDEARPLIESGHRILSAALPASDPRVAQAARLLY
jgi:hypothetical protein